MIVESPQAGVSGSCRGLRSAVFVAAQLFVRLGRTTGFHCECLRRHGEPWCSRGFAQGKNDPDPRAYRV